MTGNIEQSRETIWQENRLNFQNGCYGNPQDLESLLIFWQQMEKHHYPDARDMVERIRGIIESQRQVMEQQLAQAQASNQKLAQISRDNEDRANIAEGYISYLKGGNK
jgi:hypothetical protein